MISSVDGSASGRRLTLWLGRSSTFMILILISGIIIEDDVKKRKLPKQESFSSTLSSLSCMGNTYNSAANY